MGCTSGLTAQQDNFCRLFIELGVAVDAYDIAYPTKTARTRKSAMERASKLLALPHVVDRLAELRAVGADKTGDTIETLAAQFDEDRKFAREQMNPSAAVAATKGKAQLLGFMETRIKHSLDMTVEEAQAIIATLGPKYHGKAAFTVIDGDVA